MHKLCADCSSRHQHYQLFQHRTFPQHEVSLSGTRIQCDGKLWILEHSHGQDPKKLIEAHDLDDGLPVIRRAVFYFAP